MRARAAVEALLREKKLDRTLTSALPERLGEDAVASFHSAALDRGLAGGLPRGQVSEVVGPASSGRTSVAWAALAAASRRGESIALIDTFDRFDPPTAQAGGIDLSRLLWVRGQAISKTVSSGNTVTRNTAASNTVASNTVAIGPAWLPGTFIERVIDRAIKALNLVVQSGVCTLVVIDLIDVPAAALRRLPAATWFRIERAIEGSDTAVVILAAAPIARSTGGRSISLTGNAEPATGRSTSAGPPRTIWKGSHDRSRRLAGVAAQATVSAARWSHTARLTLSTSVINAV